MPDILQPLPTRNILDQSEKMTQEFRDWTQDVTNAVNAVGVGGGSGAIFDGGNRITGTAIFDGGSRV